MEDNILLPALLLIPLVGSGLCALMPARSAKWFALVVSLATAAVAVDMAVTFDWSATDVAQLQFYPGDDFVLVDLGFIVRFSCDAVSLWLVLLTVLLAPLAIISSFQSIELKPTAYYAWMLLLLFAMLGVFIARDLLLFYIFFELTLIPMFFIIGIWGGAERRYAAIKFFLFTFAGSIFTLAAIIYLGVRFENFDLPTLIQATQSGWHGHPPLSATERLFIVLGLVAGFAVKVPLFPVHTWLPLAHTEAPTAGSVILAGVLLKLGTYGLYKIVIPLGILDATGVALPSAVRVIAVLCVIGVIYGALAAWVQQDIKKLVAYSSVSHLGFCVLGLVALNDIGVQGSILYMINHGLSTGALFLVIGMIYDRYHTRDINELSGLARRMPILATFFVLFALSSIGLPGLNGFVSEFLTILGAFTSRHLGVPGGIEYGYVYAAFAATGIILGAVYMLHMLARVLWGPLKVPAEHDEGHQPTESHGVVATHGQADAGQVVSPGPAHHSVLGADLGLREIGILLPLAFLVIALGVYPNVILKTIEKPVQQITRSDQQAQPVLTAEADNPTIAPLTDAGL